MTSKLGPSLEVQIAIVAALSADIAVKGLIGSPARINPPQAQTWPGSYIEIGDGHDVPDLAECIDGTEVFTNIHIWSREDRSFSDAKKIAATVWDCLKSASISLAESRILPVECDNQYFERVSEQRLRDPDGTTLHVVLTIRALTEPAT